MTNRTTGPSRVIQAVTDTANDDRTFWVGVGLIGVWVVFTGVEVLGLVQHANHGWQLALAQHGSGLVGVSLAAPGTLGRIASAWKDARK